MQWWVTQGDRRPVGPVSTELLLEGIGAGKVPRDSFVCEVGGEAWKRIGEVAPFSSALGDRDEQRRPERGAENVTGPHADLGDGPGGGSPEIASSFRPSEPPPRAWLERFDDSEEKTIVDEFPFGGGDPPTEP